MAFYNIIEGVKVYEAAKGLYGVITQVGDYKVEVTFDNGLKKLVSFSTLHRYYKEVK
jgi:hypothetical protein